MLFRSILLASALAAFANAQTIVTSSASSVAPSSTVAQVMPPAATQGFDSNLVSSSTKFSWCLAQRNTCPQICGGAASLNDCNEETLQFNCVCPNGTVPDSSAYEQTVPFFVCQENFGQCINRTAGNAEEQQQCTDNAQCGTRNATAEAIAQTSGASSPTTASASGSESASASGSASATGASATATESNLASMTSYTSGAFAVMLMAIFKVLL